MLSVPGPTATQRSHGQPCGSTPSCGSAAPPHPHCQTTRLTLRHIPRTPVMRRQKHFNIRPIAVRYGRTPRSPRVCQPAAYSVQVRRRPKLSPASGMCMRRTTGDDSQHQPSTVSAMMGPVRVPRMTLTCGGDPAEKIRPAADEAHVATQARVSNHSCRKSPCHSSPHARQQPLESWARSCTTALRCRNSRRNRVTCRCGAQKHGRLS